MFSDTMIGDTCIKCKDGHFFGESGECKECIANCKECDNENTCKTCKDGYGKDKESKCVQDYCHVQECKKCSSENELLCAKCKSGYTLKDGLCVKDNNPVNPESSSSGANYLIILGVLSFVLLFILKVIKFSDKNFLENKCAVLLITKDLQI